MTEYTRTVGEQGQVTIPGESRERHGIDDGDKVTFVGVDGEIRIRRPTDEQRLAEGYRRRAERSRRLAAEMEEKPTQTAEPLMDTPDWNE